MAEADPAPADVTDTRITLTLRPDVLAGVNGVQVLQPFLVGEPPQERAAAESNAAPMVLRPTVTGTINPVLHPDAGIIDLEVPLDPPVGSRQRVVLFLNEIGAPSDRPTRAYSFIAPTRTDPLAPDPAPTVVVPTQHVLSGDYLVRVQVDGAASLLGVGADGRFDSPIVTFP